MEPVAEGIWSAEGRVVFMTQPVSTRMTVIRLRDGSLLLHSPVTFDAGLRDQVAQLGPVRHIVAPNKYHHLALPEWLAAFPEARSYAAPGLPAKRKDIAFDEVLGDEPPAAWKGELQQMVFAGQSVFNEVVFLHPATRTLLVTDLVFNLYRVDSAWSRITLRLDGIYRRFAVARMLRLTFRRPAARAALARLLAWDFDRVIMAHGDVLESGGPERMREAFAWL